MSEGIAIQDPTVNPIINFPYEEPKCHWELDERGLAKPNLLPGRRESRGTNPAPQPRANTTQPMLVDQGNELTLVNALRTSVREWRDQGYPGVTEPTRRLLDHWNSDQPTPRLFFAQKEAIETLIYMFEVADRNGYHHRTLAEVNEKFNDNIHRLTTKMATGTGKTAVMALIIIWQSVNHSHRPQDPRFTNQIAIVTPGITVRDRSRLDLIPNRPHNIYADWNLVPRRSNYTRPVENAKVAITNFHTLQTKEVTWGQPSTKAKKISRMKPSVETSRDMIKRALGTLSPRGRILVLNDEGHHCHNTQSQLVEIHGEERKNADLWFNGLRTIRDTGRLRAVIDLTATPMFITTQGASTNDQIFPWTVSDFPLTDAIESGMVKIPRIPVEDDATAGGYPVYRNLYHQSKGKTKQTRTELTSPLNPALDTLYENYLETTKEWADSQVPPVFIIVANNVPNAQAIYEYIAGYRPDEERPWEPGRLDDFSNVDPATHQPRTPPRTILIHSKLDQEDKIQGNFSKYLKQQSEAFRRAMPTYPWPKEDQGVMREIINSVGKEGKPGEQVRCVVSVAMLTEGWDTRTVTHVLGFRRFGTQLLCEQVAGRSLRRVNYDSTDEKGFFIPEYADIMGIPFEFTFKPPKGTSPPKLPSYEVHPIEERGQFRIKWPNLTGYKFIQDREIDMGIDWDRFTTIVLKNEIPELSEFSGIMGNQQYMETHHGRGGSAIFELAKELTEVINNQMGEDSPGNTRLFLESFSIIKEAIQRKKLQVTGGGLWAIGQPENRSTIASQILQACHASSRDGSTEIIPVLDAPICYTTREITPYRSSRPHWHQTRKSQMNVAPCDNNWELQAARTLDDHLAVTAWVRNDRQRWQIPYMFEGHWASYEPDFIAHIEHGAININLVIEIKGEERPQDLEKKRWAENYWIPAVNSREDLRGPATWKYLYVNDIANFHMQLTEIAGGNQW